MRAVVITKPGGPDVLQVREVSTPEPQGAQIRVRVRAAGLNRADLVQRAGHYAAPPGDPADIPGLEFAGEVDALGPLARRWQPGQRVMGLVGGGAQADYLVVHEDLVMAVPERLSDVEAGGVPEVFLTAHDALFSQADLRMGERVLIHAAGSGVGTAAIQLGHATGATTFGTSRTPEKLEQARALGLDHALGAADFDQRILEITAGTGVEVVLDTVGAPYLAQNLRAMATRGRLVYLAAMGGGHLEVPVATLLGKRLQLRGCTLRARPLGEKIAVVARFSTEVLPLLASGAVRPVIERTYPLDDIAQAQADLEANKSFGKLVLTMG